MNNSIPSWDLESDTCLTNQKKLTGLDQELVELLWQNGQVVMHSQTHKKPIGNSSNLRQVQRTDQSKLRTSGPCINSSNLSQEEPLPWIQFPPEDQLEQDFFSPNLLSELPPPSQVESCKPNIRQLEGANFAKFVASSTPHATSSSQPPNMKPSFVQELQGENHYHPMPAPRFRITDSSQKLHDFGGSRKVRNFSHFADPLFASSASHFRERVTSSNLSQSEAKECSAMTVSSSHCGSNHIPQDPDISRVSSNGVLTTTTTTTLSAEPEAVRNSVQRERTVPWSDNKGKLQKIEPTVTSSSGGSGGTSIERTGSLSTRNQGQKRKGADAEVQEEQSEATKLNSGGGNKASQRIGSSRRNRAAEVHNLSERRRRDRINEKMRALQQLIPNSNKTDKASMLEEAIEYLKSLQFQIQIMWMRAGMTPVMFPGIQHFMTQMNMGIDAPSNPMQNPMQLPNLPQDQSLSVAQIPNHNLMCQNQVLGALNFQNQMQNPCLSEQYARYMGYHLMQSASQPMNAFKYGSQAVQHSQTMIATSNNRNGPITGSDDMASGKTGSSTFN